jgi:hypothetical protein
VPDSWRLKADRAEKHLSELRLRIGEYVQKRPYEAVRIERARNCGEKHPGYDCGGSWRLQITEQPDPNLAVIAGDVIHNLRSALDHLAVALVPSSRRSHASFPIETKDIWAKQGRRYVVHEPEPRKHWRTAVKGMPPEAVAFIESMQPYRHSSPGQHLLAYLNRLENADKHRQLAILTVGVAHAICWGTARGRIVELKVETPGAFVVDDGTELFHFAGRGGPRLTDDEVQVQISGAPLVTTKAAYEGGGQVQEYQPIGNLLEAGITALRTVIFPGLEPYTRTRLHPPAP